MANMKRYYSTNLPGMVEDPNGYWVEADVALREISFLKKALNNHVDELEQADKSLAKMLRDIVAVQLERDELKTKLQKFNNVFSRWDNIDVKTLPAVAMHASYKQAFDPEPPVATLVLDGEREDITDRFDEMHRGWKALDDANDRIKVLEAKLSGKTVRMENIQAKLQQERDRRVEHRQQNQTLNEVVQRLEKQMNKALAAYDAEVISRREEVTKCHAEMGKLRAALNAAESTIERWREGRNDDLKDAVIAAEFYKRSEREKAMEELVRETERLGLYTWTDKQVDNRPPLGSHAADLECLRATQEKCDKLETEVARLRQELEWSTAREASLAEAANAAEKKCFLLEARRDELITECNQFHDSWSKAVNTVAEKEGQRQCMEKSYDTVAQELKYRDAKIKSLQAERDEYCTRVVGDEILLRDISESIACHLNENVLRSTQE